MGEIIARNMVSWLKLLIIKLLILHLVDCLYYCINLQILCQGRVLYFWVELRPCCCWQQHPKCERTICVMYPPFFCELRSSSKPHKQKSKREGRIVRARFKQLCLDTHSELDTCSYEPLFLTKTDTNTSKSIDISSLTTLYTWSYPPSDPRTMDTATKMYVEMSEEIEHKTSLNPKPKPYTKCRPRNP